MRIAIEGCAHGELERIYEIITTIEKQEGYKINLLICCGDFQCTRNLDDLQTMAVPKKYQDMCSFYKYYSGEKEAPLLTIFIGGNHEASNYLQELPYGGWVAPKIYYLGYAGVITVNGLRIAGISGIYKGHDYLRGRFEFSPYNEPAKKSVYHVRELEVFRLKQLSGEIDIFLSHDWPRGIYNYGNMRQLVRFKPHFKEEIDCNKLGSPPCEDLLKTLKPSFWFAAHLHCKFAALIPHEESDKVTKFLALDKCLPKRRFLQILEVESDYVDAETKLEYDLEWLTILFLTNHLINAKNTMNYMPGPNCSTRFNFTPTDEEKEFVRAKFNYDLTIPDNFLKTAEIHNPLQMKRQPQQPKSQINPQTTAFCDLLGVDDPLSIAMLLSGHELSHSNTFEGSASEANLLAVSGDQSSESFNLSQTSPLKRKSLMATLPKPKCVENNPDEVFLEANEEEIASAEESHTPNTSYKCEEDTIELKKPVIKKFKRRNQDFYQQDDDDEN